MKAHESGCVCVECERTVGDAFKRLERKAIRRAIAPALRELNRYFRSKKGFETGDWWHQAIVTIDRATRRAKGKRT